MPIAAPLASSADRPLPLRARPDLRASAHSYQGRAYWLVSDPLSGRHFRFENEEYALLQMLDGAASSAEVQSRFERRFAPQTLSFVELHRFLGSLRQSGLVVSLAEGQGRLLARRGAEQARHKAREALGNPLAIRLASVDADRCLGWLAGEIGWLFSGMGLLLAALFTGAAGLLVFAQFDTFCRKLPTFQEFFAAGNWLALGAALAAVKVWHELGHGVACKRFGGECRELGLLLLLGMPCLYCDVSDSWRLPSKWRRAAIGAAGIYFELLLASACVFLWWFSVPGVFNSLCLNIVFVASAGTLLFNANPLMRYDGYYILSDLAEIPNLRRKADAALRGWLGRLTLGLPETHDPYRPARGQALFAAFAVAAPVYGWIVTFSILWLLYHVLEPYGLKIVGQLLALGMLGSLVGRPLWRAVRLARVPGALRQVRPMRLMLTLLAAAFITGLALAAPCPHHVFCELVVQPRDAATVYVEAPGALRAIHATPGRQARAFEPLVTLENTDTAREVTRLQGERRRLRAQLAGLKQLALDDPQAASRWAETEASLAAVEDQLLVSERDLRRLRVTAPREGYVFPAPHKPKPGPDDEQLAEWTGTPLDAKNLGAHLTPGVVVCQIGDKRRLEACMVIDQADVEYVAAGQPIEILFTHAPTRAWRSSVARVSRLDLKHLPAALTSQAGGQAATKPDAAGRRKPLTAMFEASAPLDDARGELFVGARGQARVLVGKQTLGARAWRLLCQTFHFEL